jgi:DNA polymerase-3 subunit epsilon/CBS domain-containing protein
MAAVSSVTPLIALEAVAIDTETTGLDTRTARIVQLGAVRVGPEGRIGEACEALVNPGIPIPPGSSKIHGLTDADVAAAESFAMAWAALWNVLDGALLIGHSIGFDLAVLAAEAERNGIPWQRPRTLCVRLLGHVANPTLPDQSLDTLAAWLGVTIEGRHSALGDARAAAAVFGALLPHLERLGIRTVAEAERACLSRTAALDEAGRAGWSDAVGLPPPPPTHVIDPFAYRNRVGELMNTPPFVQKPTDTVHSAIDLMARRRISSVLVHADGVADRNVEEYGIVTQRDIMRLVAAHGADAFGQELGSVATRSLASVRADAFAYRAIGRMDRLRVRHLVVRDAHDRVVGMVSARDLLRLRAAAAINLDDSLQASKTVSEMAAAWAMLPDAALALIREGVEAPVVAEIVSEELRAVTRRAAILAEQAMLGDGRGAPPRPYALLVLGSGGRGESLLAADQDNAIVFADGEPDESHDRWFAELGEHVAATLDKAGVPLCKGGVMASNGAWRGSLEHWKRRVLEWVARSRPEDLLNVDIFFDFRPVHGDHGLADALANFAADQARDRPVFSKLLGERVAVGNPFGILGGFNTENGRLDLKRYGLFPIVAAARTLALRHGIRALSTRDRIAGLLTTNTGAESDLSAMQDAHAFFLRLLLAQQGRDLFAGLPASNRVETATLDRRSQRDLKSALKTVQTLPQLVRDLMFA